MKFPLILVVLILCLFSVGAQNTIQTKLTIVDSAPEVGEISTYVLYTSPNDNIAEDEFYFCTNEDSIIIYADLRISDGNGLEVDEDNLSISVFLESENVSIGEVFLRRMSSSDTASVVSFDVLLQRNELSQNDSANITVVFSDGIFTSISSTTLPISIRQCHRTIVHSFLFNSLELFSIAVNDSRIFSSFFVNNSVLGAVLLEEGPRLWGDGDAPTENYGPFIRLRITPNLEDESSMYYLGTSVYDEFSNKNMRLWVRPVFSSWNQLAIFVNKSQRSGLSLVESSGEFFAGKKGKGGSGECEPTVVCGPWSDCQDEIKSRTCYEYSCIAVSSSYEELESCNPADPIVISPEQSVKHSRGKKALFDIYLELLSSSWYEGDDVSAKVGLINFGTEGEVIAHIDFTITDHEGVMVLYEEVEQSVFSQLEYIQVLNTSVLKSGSYVLIANLTYLGQEEPAFAVQNFDITNPARFSFWYLLSFVIVVVIAIVFRKLSHPIKISSKNTESSRQKNFKPLESTSNYEN